jgi:hypothetical protein
MLSLLLLGAVAFFSLLCWWPVLTSLAGFFAGRDGNRQHAEHESEWPLVHVFADPGCAGESLTLMARPPHKRSHSASALSWGALGDLCGQRYPSGAALKDNVASLLVMSATASGGAGIGGGYQLDIFATCRTSEHPRNPMLLQSVRAGTGCVELSAPLAGHLSLRRAEEDEASEL